MIKKLDHQHQQFTTISLMVLSFANNLHLPFAICSPFSSSPPLNPLHFLRYYYLLGVYLLKRETIARFYFIQIKPNMMQENVARLTRREMISSLEGGNSL